MLESKQNVNISEIKRESKGWDRKTRTLTPQAQVVIGTAVTAATAGVGSTIGAGIAGGIGAGGAVGTGVSSAIAAGVSGFASSVVVGAANNGGNVGKGIKASTSKEALRSLDKNMLAAGITTGVMNGTGFGNVAEKAKLGGVAGRNQGIFERVLLRTGVNTAIKGGSLRDNFKSEVLHGALAVGQGYIGDIGQRYGLSERGAAKVMMHSALGGTYALASKGNVAIGMLVLAVWVRL
ncbi:hypothetical protein A3306_01810 [Rickettsia bellii]|uniref:DUF637 domain-containing protein n=1 Tax=Rickettsia bellii str. RML An4 TaxID=1359193 RepID=A0A0F3QE64_RICBE|nr:DUF637 domain-containing protein [Rickettsia bellii]ARD85996.1 hypothetical protein A3306_01810 [Rickettsia bellii]KJV90547.1 hypothetical protein RBEAN4_1553 [Rickettsia bellii str. RML An4]